MAKKEPYDMTNSYARMERDKRKAIGNPNKNVHHKKNGSNYQKDTGSMVRSTSARQEPEKPFFFLNPLFFAFSDFSACHHLTP